MNCRVNLQTEIGRELFTQLKQSIITRLFPYECRTNTILATTLDPRFKLLAYRTDEQVHNARKVLQSAIKAELDAKYVLEPRETVNNDIVPIPESTS